MLAKSLLYAAIINISTAAYAVDATTTANTGCTSSVATQVKQKVDTAYATQQDAWANAAQGPSYQPPEIKQAAQAIDEAIKNGTGNQLNCDDWIGDTNSLHKNTLSEYAPPAVNNPPVADSTYSTEDSQTDSNLPKTCTSGSC